MSSRLLIMALCIYGIPALSQVVVEFPRDLQFYPRGKDDSAVVPISGRLAVPGYDSIYLEALRNGALYNRFSAPVKGEGDGAAFEFQPKIRAELAEYSFRLYAKSSTSDDLLASADSIVAGDVYFIAGQSNAILGRGDVKWRDEYCRTFGVYNSPFAADTNWALAAADTNNRNPAVGVWALYLQKQLADTYKTPICIINGAVGGKAIGLMLRNDSKPTNLTTVYGMMLYRALKSGLSQYAKAMFWYQGESNTSSGYETSFATLYEDWKQDYPNLEKIYVFQIRPGCNANREHAALREIQRNLPLSYPNIRTISAMGIPYHDGCHFLTSGYEIIAGRVFQVLARDFYGSADTAGIDGPNIAKAYYTNGLRTEVALVFSPLTSELRITPDTVIGSVTYSMKDYFYLDDTAGMVAALRASGDTLFLTLNAPSDAAWITYLPDKYYSGTQVVYEGPWIVNERGAGAFSFWHFPIQGPAGVERTDIQVAEGFAVYPNPANRFSTFALTLDRDDEVTIELYDLLGRKLSTVLHEPLAAGSYNIPFIIERSDQALIARLTTSELSRSLKFITTQ